MRTVCVTTLQRRNADALRINFQDMEAAIENVRKCFRRGDKAAASRVAKSYAALIRAVHEQKEKGAALGNAGPLYDEWSPLPYRTGFVGISAERQREIEWKGVMEGFYQ